MRRNEREIKDLEEIKAIIQGAQVCRIGFSEKDIPYIVPMDFGYKDDCLYFHCANEGKKLELIRQNNKVCFEMDIDHHIVKSEGRPCEWSARYRSVIGFGKAFVIENLREKSTAMNIVMEHTTEVNGTSSPRRN
jgi:uncharacterized protein